MMNSMIISFIITKSSVAFNVIKPNLRFYSCVILNDYKTWKTIQERKSLFYSCVILNDYKTYIDTDSVKYVFYSCVILNDYKTYEK